MRGKILSVLLSKLSGNEDIVTGSPVSGRTSHFLDTVGMFVNTIALGSKPEGTKSVMQLMQEIRDTSISAIDNQNYPFGELVKKLGIDTAGRNPLFDVMLSYQSFEMTDITFGDEKAELLPLETMQAGVFCKNRDKGAKTRKQCKVGCIGCMKCAKACEFGAVTVKDNVAHVDYEKCTGCGKCAEACPVKAINIVDIKRH